jgi:hypothetical protein
MKLWLEYGDGAFELDRPIGHRQIDKRPRAKGAWADSINSYPPINLYSSTDPAL